MRKEAAAKDFYDSPGFPGQEFPRLQILIIEGLLNGSERPRRPPDLADGALTFKKAAKEKPTGKGTQGELF